MLKRVMGMIVPLLLFGLISSTEVLALSEEISPFNDIKSDHWAYKEVTFTTSEDIIQLKTENYFYPYEKITRAEAVSVLARSLKLNEDKTCSLKFQDVSTTNNYYWSLCHLVELNVMEDGKYFYPNKYISRAEFITLLTKAYKIQVDDKNRKQFTDLKNHPAKNTIETLADLKMVSGVNTNEFAPERILSRVQMAIFITRAIEFKQKMENYEIIYDYLSKDFIETKQYSTELVDEVISLVNEERRKVGAPELVKDHYLSQIAVIKASDFIQRDYFNHYSPYYGQPWDLAGLFGYRFTSLGENIAKNFFTPESVVKAWMKSPSHRENMLRFTYSNIGVGAVQSDNGEIYWVQLFTSK